MGVGGGEQSDVRGEKIAGFPKGRAGRGAPMLPQGCTCSAPVVIAALRPKLDSPASRGHTSANGVVAQLGERVVRNDEVRGSIPLGSTKYKAK